MPTFTALSTATIARRAADLPHLGGRNLLETATTIAWRSTGSLSSGADITEAGYPGARAGDGRAAEHTRPSTTAATHYLCIDLGAVRTYDMVGVFGLALVSGVLGTVSLEAADNAAYTSGLTTLASTTGPFYVGTSTAVTRIVEWVLDGSAQSVAARYLRLRIDYVSAGRAVVGEVYAGSRLALPYRATSPVDPTERPELAEGDNWESDTGRLARVAAPRGRLGGTIGWSLDLGDEAAALTWARDVAWGRYAGIYAPRPLSEPSTVALVRFDALSLTERVYGARDLDVEMTEQAPTLAREGL